MSKKTHEPLQEMNDGTKQFFEKIGLMPILRRIFNAEKMAGSFQKMVGGNYDPKSKHSSEYSDDNPLSQKISEPKVKNLTEPFQAITGTYNDKFQQFPSLFAKFATKEELQEMHLAIEREAALRKQQSLGQSMAESFQTMVGAKDTKKE